MDVKNLSPQESMAIITEMIEASKQRMAMPDLRISVMWALVTILTAAFVLAMALSGHHSPWVNLAWLAIPVIGIPATILSARKAGAAKGAKTALDRISDGIWKIVGIVAVLMSGICIVFNLMGYPQAWLCMFFYAFIIVGFGAAVQGIILRESSYVFGGVFSIVAGSVLLCLTICRVSLLIVWVLPLYMLCFLLMFILPAFVISKKIKNRK